MTSCLLQEDRLLLESFLSDSDSNYILIRAELSGRRGAIHRWADKNSCYSRTEYKSPGKRLVSITCSHCLMTNTDQEDLRQVDPKLYYLCLNCIEFTDGEYYRHHPDQIKIQRYPVPTGHMIVMKNIIPNCDSLAPSGGSWKGKKKRCRTKKNFAKR